MPTQLFGLPRIALIGEERSETQIEDDRTDRGLQMDQVRGSHRRIQPRLPKPQPKKGNQHPDISQDQKVSVGGRCGAHVIS